MRGGHGWLGVSWSEAEEEPTFPCVSPWEALRQGADGCGVTGYGRARLAWHPRSCRPKERGEKKREKRTKFTQAARGSLSCPSLETQPGGFHCSHTHTHIRARTHTHTHQTQEFDVVSVAQTDTHTMLARCHQAKRALFSNTQIVFLARETELSCCGRTVECAPGKAQMASGSRKQQKKKKKGKSPEHVDTTGHGLTFFNSCFLNAISNSHRKKKKKQ